MILKELEAKETKKIVIFHTSKDNLIASTET